MRRLIGVLVVLGGLAALCYVAMTNHAARIQAAIAENAGLVVADADPMIDLRVVGRDITATGRVTDQVALATLRSSLADINGVRVVDVSGVETLPLADPYEMRFTLNVGDVIVDGVAPDAALRALFDGPRDTVTLAAGLPDAAWIDVALQTRQALGGLILGDAVLSNQTLTLRGLARTPDHRDDILTTLGPLPAGYTLINEIEVEDDGAPLSLSLIVDADGVLAGGKLPADMAPSDITDRFGQIDAVRIDQATIPSADPGWPDLARTAIDATALLIDGSAKVDGAGVTITGRGTPDAIAQASALLASVSDRYTVTSDLSLWDDGAPFELTMDWDGATATASGKIPADLTLQGPSGTPVSSTAAVSFLPDDGTFSANLAAGAAALGLLNTGQLTVTTNAITLSGTATSPQVGVAMDRVLQDATTTDITRDITYLDDGSPAAWSLNYAANAGAMIEGRLPAGLGVTDIAAALGLASITGTPVTAVEDTDLGTSLDTLAIAARYLPEVETMTYARDGAGSALDLVLSPGVNIDLVAVDLAAALPTDVAFSLAPLQPAPADGTTRRNAATGVDEVFTGGFWLPDLDFATDVTGCTDASGTILSSAEITFLSGSARLDATSIRAINGLAAVVRPCLNAGLRLEIGGHTDDTGNPDSNEDLSFDRAAEVRAALIDRGATADVMTPVGYGQTQPIVSNETEEGRAQNRRTTLTWTQP